MVLCEICVCNLVTYLAGGQEVQLSLSLSGLWQTKITNTADTLRHTYCVNGAVTTHTHMDGRTDDVYASGACSMAQVTEVIVQGSTSFQFLLNSMTPSGFFFYLTYPVLLLPSFFRFFFYIYIYIEMGFYSYLLLKTRGF